MAMTKADLVDDVMADLLGLAERAADGFKNITGQDIIEAIGGIIASGQYVEAE